MRILLSKAADISVAWSLKQSVVKNKFADLLRDRARSVIYSVQISFECPVIKSDYVQKGCRKSHSILGKKDTVYGSSGIHDNKLEWLRRVPRYCANRIIFKIVSEYQSLVVDSKRTPSSLHEIKNLHTCCKLRYRHYLSGNNGNGVLRLHYS